MPNPFLADDDLVRAGLAGPAVAHRQLAGCRGERAADVVAARAAARRSRSTSRTVGPASVCSRSATSIRPAMASSPTSTSNWAWYWPAATRWRRWMCGARLPRRWDSAHASTRPIRPPDCTRPDRRPCRSAATRSARSARCIPMCSMRTVSTSVLPFSSSTFRSCSPTRPRSRLWKPTSRFPSSDLDLAFTTPDSVTAEKVEKAIKQAAGALLVDVALFDVYRGAGLPARHPQPGLSAAAAGPRPHAQRHRADRGASQGRRRRRQTRGNASLIQTLSQVRGSE